jgi:hypothetical protein
MKYWEQMFARYVYNHCNIWKHLDLRLQHISATSETFGIYAYNMRFFNLLPYNAEQSGEQLVLASRWPRMVVRSDSEQLRLHLVWTWLATTLSSGRLATHVIHAPMWLLLSCPCQLDPNDDEEARRLVGGGHDKRVARWRRLRRAGCMGAAMEKAAKWSGEVVEASNFFRSRRSRPVGLLGSPQVYEAST